jgi:hypothetical protein
MRSFLNFLCDFSDLRKGQFSALPFKKIFNSVSLIEQGWVSSFQFEHLHHSREVVTKYNKLAKLLISNL